MDTADRIAFCRRTLRRAHPHESKEVMTKIAAAGHLAVIYAERWASTDRERRRPTRTVRVNSIRSLIFGRFRPV